MASQILVYKLAADFLGKDGFSEYALARRAVSLISPLLLLGLGVAVPRYIAFKAAENNPDRAERYFGAGLATVGMTTAISTFFAVSCPGWCAYILFGSKTYSYLVFPLNLLLVGLAFHSIVYAYFRGRLAMSSANSLQFMNLGVVPPAAFLVFGHSVKSVVTATGLLAMAVAGIALFFTPVRQLAGNNLSEAKELLRYGVQRFPGEFIQMALLTLPAIIVAHLRGVQEAGAVAFGTSVLMMIASLFAPIGLILLPKASRMLAEGATRELREHVIKLLQITTVVSFTVTALIWIFAGPITRLYLGFGFEEVVTVVRLVIFGAVPFCLYYALRGLIDAFFSKGINTRNLFIALLLFSFFFGSTYLLGVSLAGIMVSLLLALVGLGLLSLFEAKKIIGAADRPIYQTQCPLD
jgi:O-antigen/teichoic acid export membrane protein